MQHALRQHHPAPRSSRGSRATRTSSAASGPSSAGTPRSWSCKANKHAEGIGGHLSTFASLGRLYEVGFNHFFRGKDDGQPGDHVYFQGHAAPGIYARAFLEGRLDEDAPRPLPPGRSAGGTGPVARTRTPGSCPTSGSSRRCRWASGPINSIYQARFNRYLQHRRIDDTVGSRVWCFLGDGETDEPETLGSISLAAREQLDNLILVVNCNLQRLDGPVRGNGKIIQELEAIFRGAGWNVIKVIWGSKWDELLARDVDGVLLNKMNTTVDGEFQRYAVESGAYIREHFFGPDPRLRSMVEHLSDDDLRSAAPRRPRLPQALRRLQGRHRARRARRRSSWPRPIKGWTLGSEVEARNATHQIKKMTDEQLRALRDRLYLQDEIPEEALDGDRAALLPAAGGLAPSTGT